MNFKYFYSLSGRYPILTNSFCVSSRCHHSLILKEKFLMRLRCMPLQIQKHSMVLLRLHSHVANQEKLSKESQNIVEVQPLQFGDIAFDQPITHEELIVALQKHESIAEQMEALAATLALSSEDGQRRIQFCKTMESLFRPFFNDFRIQMFGSTVNCFGFKGCDIDMTFEVCGQKKSSACYIERPDVPLVGEVLSGKVSPKELSELPAKEQLIFIHSVFLEYYKDSEIPAKFINAHVPLVRFYHDRFNLKCDLTMKNRVAFANTKLLYLYAKLDKRVVPLMMTIRYWAKYTELIGKGLQFNTYTISLLVIYFLQTRSPPILPSAEYVLSLSDKFETEEMDEESFLAFVNSIPPTKNNQTLDELLKEFFFFYLYFDFTRVIRPLTATAEAREDFFPREENRRFRMNTICVQDPLCRSHNVAELVEYKLCRKFFTDIMVICKMFQNASVTPGECNLITLLNTPDEWAFRKVNAQRVVSFTLPIISKGGDTSSDENISSSAQTVLHILQHALLFDCHTLDINQILSLLKRQDEIVTQQKKELQEKYHLKLRSEEAIPHLKNRKKKNPPAASSRKTVKEEEESLLEQFQNFNLDHKLVLGAQCNVSKNTWLGRDLFQLDSSSTASLLDREQLLSECVAKQNEPNLTEKKIKPFLFVFECYVAPENPQELLVNFRPLQRMSFNPILGIFLKEYIPKIVKNIID